MSISIALTIIEASGMGVNEVCKAEHGDSVEIDHDRCLKRGKLLWQGVVLTQVSDIVKDVFKPFVESQ